MSYSNPCDNIPIVISNNASLYPILTREMFENVAIPYEQVTEIPSPLGGVRVLITPNLIPIDYPIPVYATYCNDKLYILVNTGLNGQTASAKWKFFSRHEKSKEIYPLGSLEYYVDYLTKWVETNLEGCDIHWYAVNRTPESPFTILAKQFCRLENVKKFVPQNLIAELIKLNPVHTANFKKTAKNTIMDISKINELCEDTFELLLSMASSIDKS